LDEPEGIAAFAGDLPEHEQKVVWATHAAASSRSFHTKKLRGLPGNRTKLVHCSETGIALCHQNWSDSVAKRMSATTFETDSSHVPMLSQPDFVLDVIRKAAKGS